TRRLCAAERGTSQRAPLRKAFASWLNDCELRHLYGTLRISTPYIFSEASMKYLFGLAASLTMLFSSLPAVAQESARMARTPDISPDGKLVAFTYLGDIWTVEASGGRARAITQHVAHDYYPRFSPDGQSIAFASNRHGSYDV